MRITKRQLRRIIKEEFSGYASERPRNPMERSYAATVEDYEAWVQEMGHITPAASSVLATYLIDQGLEQDTERTGILASEYKMDKTDVARELEAQFAEAEAGIVDDAESFRRGFYEGTNMKITKHQLRRIVKEAIIHEAEFYDETPEGQLVGTEKEDAVFTNQLNAERIMKQAGLTKNEISQMWPFIKGTVDPWGFMETPMYEKLFGWFTFDADPEDRMPYNVAKARDDVPDEWILGRLAA